MLVVNAYGPSVNVLVGAALAWLLAAVVVRSRRQNRGVSPDGATLNTRQNAMMMAVIFERKDLHLFTLLKMCCTVLSKQIDRCTRCTHRFVRSYFRCFTSTAAPIPLPF